MNSSIEARRGVNRNQKAWKFIRDVNGISLKNLSIVAIYDGDLTYTYGQMFREWERYAAVFSHLGMTKANKSRVGILGTTSAEVIFAVYGLDMTGASVSIVPSYNAFFPHKIMDTIKSEMLTDFIITDDLAQVNLINDLLIHRNELGINNVIILHTPISGVTVNSFISVAQEMKYMQIKGCFAPICMDELLAAYGNTTVSYDLEDSDNEAFILHTSGTTNGVGKPIVLSDFAFNAAVSSFFEMENLKLPEGDLVTAVIVDLSNAYGIVDQVHLPFAMGAAVVMVPCGVLNPWFYKAIPKYKISFLFTISAMFERWMKMPESKGLDFSSLEFVAIGGSSVSAADKKRFYKFLQEHGAGDITILNGYGISELCGACCLSLPDLDDESIGYPLPGVSIRLYDEEKDRFLPEESRSSEGVMYLWAPFVATTRINDKEILKAEYIDDRPYICTNDFVRIDDDGKVTFLGRANRYFINDEGRKYESGRVETEIARQSGIENCCVVPIYVKTLHDNMPMLCVQTLRGEMDAKDTIKNALRQVFVVEKTLPEDYIPFRVMITESLPRNGNGKIDLYKIGRGEVEGEVFTVDNVKKFKHITDFKLKPYKEGKADMIKEVFDNISKEMKSSIPFSKVSFNENEERQENTNMSSAKKAFESFNSMNRMGMQMMNNMMGKMGGSQCGMPLFPGMMPDFQNMMQGFQNMMPGAQNMMPNFQNMMPNFQNMMPNFQNMMPNFQNMMSNWQNMMQGFQSMMPGCQNMMPAFQNMMQGYLNMMPFFQGKTMNMTQNMGPMMLKQMEEMMGYMTRMNQISIDAMQKMYEENLKMTNRFYEAMKNMTEGTYSADNSDDASQEKETEAKEDKVDISDSVTTSDDSEIPKEEAKKETKTKKTPVKTSTRAKTTKTSTAKTNKKGE
ncbi:class I adenylate-forming enzyme family protein [Butyrivibrio sp. WCE2006]|uniref:class I adenylate-forming enzyme family protein n=1 Tax=Butyrivibrio sp. WCE2006 TaxID=1410611 RepID=UPI000A6E5B87|nr:class I adenylate-forming enzyme family protein [Butyrivibrio sp. WCE2006]